MLIEEDSPTHTPTPPPPPPLTKFILSDLRQKIDDSWVPTAAPAHSSKDVLDSLSLQKQGARCTSLWWCHQWLAGIQVLKLSEEVEEHKKARGQEEHHREERHGEPKTWCRANCTWPHTTLVKLLPDKDCLYAVYNAIINPMRPRRGRKKAFCSYPGPLKCTPQETDRYWAGILRKWPLYPGRKPMQQATPTPWRANLRAPFRPSLKHPGLLSGAADYPFSVIPQLAESKAFIQLPNISPGPLSSPSPHCWWFWPSQTAFNVLIPRGRKCTKSPQAPHFWTSLVPIPCRHLLTATVMMGLSWCWPLIEAGYGSKRPSIYSKKSNKGKTNELVMGVGGGAKYIWVIRVPKPGIVVHTFNSSTWEAEESGSLSSRPAWSTEGVPGQSEPRLHRETLWGVGGQFPRKERHSLIPALYGSLPR
jgi:hypothetical protein